ncbi:glycoside hydrolase, partial [Phakopsora pachyrhizi]
ELSIYEEFLNFKNFILEQSFHGKKVSSSKIAGPNAPLFSTCSDPASKFSALQAVKHWISTGIPAKKMILGIPSYGYAYTLKLNKLTETKFSGDSKKTSHLFQSTTGVPPKAQKTANLGGDKDACGNVNPPGGQWLFKELSGPKKLTSNAKKCLGGFERHYNSCTQTPFIFNPETCSLISYNDPTSFRAKAKFVLRHGLALLL